MPLALCTDVSFADWIISTDEPWTQITVFGPPRLAAYARLRFLPDPSYKGQSENDAERDGAPDAVKQWQALLELLAENTEAPDDCFFAVWDGWGLREPLHGRPKFSLPPNAEVPARSYFLYRGSLADAWDWGNGKFSTEPYEPAFIWPTGQNWCVANDVDPHWATIGGDSALINQLVADPRLDAVPVDPTQEPPFYR